MSGLFDLFSIIQNHWILSLLILLITLVYVHYVIYFGEIRRLGLSGPRPMPIFGNLVDLFWDFGEMHLTFERCVKKYGRVFGMYFMKDPSIVVADPQILKEVMVKEFSSFHDRPKGGFDFPEPMASMLTTVTGERWKNIRSILTPAFTTGKLKDVMAIMNRVVDTFLTKCDAVAKSGETFDIYKWYQGVTMETILTAANGIQAESQTNPDDPATKCATKALNPSLWANILVMIPLIGNTLAKWIMPTRFGFGYDDLEKLVRHIISERRKQGIENDTSKDILHLMLAAQDPDRKGHKLTDTEVMAQNMIFLLAGYETSSVTLGLTTYHLALYPEIQDKVQEEIDRICSSGTIEYQSLPDMVYLDAVISETLRIFPPAILTTRACTKSCEIHGIQFKENVGVLIPIYTLHHDAKYWEDPEAFKPERFLPEAKDTIDPFAYMPFGQGPRNCIGMRFALLEIKLVLAQMLKEFRIEKTPDLHVPITLKQKNLRVPVDPISIRLKKRGK